MDDEYIRRQIDEMKIVLENVVLNSSKGKKILELAKAYLNDSEYFFKKGDFFRALEAASISWAYIDAGLHLGVFSLDKKYRNMFTV